jgi:gliding motility-associated-like protein
MNIQVKFNKFFKICLFSAMLLTGQHLKASHVVAADISYKHLNGNLYEFTLTVFTECGASGTLSDSLKIDYSSIGSNLQGIFKVGRVGNPVIIRSCTNSPSKCEDGTTPGFLKTVFKGTFKVPSPQKDWVFSWQECNRSHAITTIKNPGTKCMYIESTLNNADVTGNSSPVFQFDPVSFLVAGKEAKLNPGTIESDGDKIVYSLTPPRYEQKMALDYNGTYSYQNPLTSVPALTLDKDAGDILLHPTIANERTVMAIKVEEYRNNILVGSVIRDLQFTVLSGSNNPPDISGINGTTLTDTTVEAGKKFCFRINGSDKDAGQKVTFSWDNGIAGATFTSGQFCWTPSATDISDEGKTFTVQLADDACPQSSTPKKFRIKVKASSDCPLSASFSWDSACTGSNIKFLTENSSSGITSWSWDFGYKGQISDKKEPEVKKYYDLPGTYTVKLVVGDGKCSTPVSRSIKICSRPVVDFDVFKCQASNFTDLSTSDKCAIKQRIWTVEGREFIAIAQIIDYSFATPGEKQIKFKVVNESNCAAEATKTYTIDPSPTPPLVDTKSFFYKCNKLDTVITITNYDATQQYAWSNIGSPAVVLTPTASTPASMKVTMTAAEITTQGVSISVTNKINCSASTSVSFSPPLFANFSYDPYCNPNIPVKFNATNGIKSTWEPNTYLWDFNDGTTDTVPDPSHLFLKDDVYAVNLRVTDHSGCVKNVPRTVYHTLPDKIFIVSEDTVCNNQDQLQYSGPSFPGGKGGTISYEWKFNGRIINSTQNSGNFIPNAEKNQPLSLKIIYNTIDGKSCTLDTIKNIYVRPSPKIRIDSIVGKCVPDSVHFYTTQTGGETPVNSYDWTFTYKKNLTQAGVAAVEDPIMLFKDNGVHDAQLIVTDTKGCRNSLKTQFRMILMPPACYDAVGQCTNERLDFSNRCTFENPVIDPDLIENIDNHYWNFGDSTPINNSSTNVFHPYTKAGKYTVIYKISDEDNYCFSQTSKEITILPQPVAHFQYDSVCFGLQTALYGDSIPSGGAGETIKSYKWYFGDGDSSIVRSPLHLFKDSTVSHHPVDYVVVNSLGCGDTIRQQVFVKPNPVADFTFDFDEASAYKPIYFYNKSSSDVVEWLYQFGNGDALISTIGDVTYQYSGVAKHEVKLVVRNNYSCYDSIVKKIDLNAYMLVPNTFTPNDDKHNDHFDIIHKGVEDIFEYKVYNRWGQVVFDGGTDKNAYWDGTFHDADQPSGVYVYYISGKTVYGENVSLKGNLTLLR